MQETISRKLEAQFIPHYLDVEDESHGHNVAEGAESHFKVVMVSSVFTEMRAVKRHQQVYGALNEELAGSVHALALHLYTPVEWDEKGNAPKSPACLGGSKNDKQS